MKQRPGHTKTPAARTFGQKHGFLKANVKLARSLWGELSTTAHERLKALVLEYGFSIVAGDIQLLNSSWYVTHAGLLRLSSRRKCAGIRTSLLASVCERDANSWVFKAIVYKSHKSKGFSGYGDADPSNVSPSMHGAEMRIAETRAVNRALRKAYGIGLCSVEELDWSPKQHDPAPRNHTVPSNGNGHSNGQPRLRDQLCLLIRQYNLDPNLVKAYAAHFCGTETLKDASRDLVQSFVSHLAASAKEDLDGLLCKLQSFAPDPEVHP